MDKIKLPEQAISRKKPIFEVKKKKEEGLQET